jgi:hypothetical protein
MAGAERKDAPSQLQETTDPRQRSRLMRGLGHFVSLLSLVPSGLGRLTHSESAFDADGNFLGMEVPQPTYAFGAMGRFQANQYEVGPSQAQLDAEPIIEQAMGVADPWAEGP